MEIVNPLTFDKDNASQEPVTPLDRQSKDRLMRSLSVFYERGKAARRPYESPWKEYERYWKGDQRSQGQPKYVFNHIFKIVEQKVASMTEERATIRILPTAPEDEELAEVLTMVVDWSVRRTGLLLSIRDTLRTGHIKGDGIAKLFWNPDAERGLGNSEYRNVQLERFVVDPDATSIGPDYNDAAFVAHQLPVDVNYIYRRYGVRVQPDPLISDRLTGTQDLFIANTNTTLGQINIPPVSGSPTSIATQRTNLLEIYARDWVLEQSGISIPKPSREEAKHPDWFIVVMTETDHQILEVRPNPYGRLPFAHYKPISVGGQFYGLSEVQQLIDPQREYNYRRTQMARHAAMHAHPMALVNPRTRFDPDSIVIGPGKVYPLLGDFQFLPTPPIDSAVTNSAMFSLKDMDDISGVTDVSRGNPRNQIESGVAIEALQSRAAVRTNATMRNYEELVRELGEMIVRNALLGWTQPRIIRLIGETDVADFKRVNLPQLLSQANDILEFDIEVRVGSSQVEKSREQQMAILLRQMQAIDKESLLEMMDVPNRTRVLQRLEEEDQKRLREQLLASGRAAPEQSQNPVEQIAQAQSIGDLPEQLQPIMEYVAEKLGRDVAEGEVLPMLREEVRGMMASEEG